MSTTSNKWPYQGNLFTVRRFSYLLMIFWIMSCQKDNGIHVIDARVQPYIDRFLNEGELRGVVLDVDAVGLEARIETVLFQSSGHVLGFCNNEDKDNHYIVLDAKYWPTATDLEKELLVFHELGHCLLGRDHDDTTLADGTCLSIMHSGTGSCRNAYSIATRKAYLDELFRN